MNKRMLEIGMVRFIHVCWLAATIHVRWSLKRLLQRKVNSTQTNVTPFLKPILCISPNLSGEALSVLMSVWGVVCNTSLDSRLSISRNLARGQDFNITSAEGQIF